MFARELWGKRPQHRRLSDPQSFGDLLSLDDVDRIVSTTGVRLPAFRLVKDAVILPSGRYTKTTRTGTQTVSGVIDSRAVFDEFADGATLVFQSMHRYWEPLMEYCRNLELALGHPVQANAYITPPGAQGFAAHEDPHDVFVLQSHGTKHWTVHDRHDLPPSNPPIIDGLLEPGDALYVPAGFPHSAKTQERASVHITIGILAITWVAAVKEALKTVESAPGIQRSPPTSVLIRRRPLRRGGQATSGTDWIVGHRSRSDGNGAKAATQGSRNRQPLSRGHLHRLLTLDDVDDRTEVVRRTGSICVVETRDSELAILLGDRELRLPQRVGPAMNVLAAGERVVVADLPGLDEAGRIVLVRRLIREGLLEVAG